MILMAANTPRKILLVTSRFPFPAVGGDKIRVIQLMESLGNFAEIHLMSLVEREPMSEHMEEARRFAHSVTCIHHPKLRSYFAAALALLHGRPLQEGYYWSRDMQAAVKDRSDCDTIFCSLIRTARYASGFNGMKVLDMCDLISLNYRNARAQTTSLKWKIIFSIESWLLKRVEIEALGTFDRTFFINAAEMQGLPFPERLVCVPNRAPASFLEHPCEENTRAFHLAFLGKMDYQPNIDAVLWFLNFVLPQLPYTVKLEIIGPGMPDDLRARVETHPNVSYLGYVDNLPATVAKASAMIAPMKTGGGVQNKILEGMALGVPVITTPLAGSGLLGAENNSSILIRETPLEWAQAISALAENRNWARSIGEAGRNIIKKYYSADRITPLVAKALMD